MGLIQYILKRRALVMLVGCGWFVFSIAAYARFFHSAPGQRAIPDTRLGTDASLTGMFIKEVKAKQGASQAGQTVSLSPTLLSHLNPATVPATSRCTEDGSGSESVCSLREKETHLPHT